MVISLLAAIHAFSGFVLALEDPILQPESRLGGIARQRDPRATVVAKDRVRDLGLAQGVEVMAWGRALEGVNSEYRRRRRYRRRRLDDHHHHLHRSVSLSDPSPATHHCLRFDVLLLIKPSQSRSGRVRPPNLPGYPRYLPDPPSPQTNTRQPPIPFISLSRGASRSPSGGTRRDHLSADPAGFGARGAITAVR
jgi:hypothetical protein